MLQCNTTLHLQLVICAVVSPHTLPLSIWPRPDANRMKGKQLHLSSPLFGSKAVDILLIFQSSTIFGYI